jgi:hypothetical protein
MQSAATAGTLITNALNLGYKKDDIIEKEVTEKEFADIMATQQKVIFKSQVEKLAEVLVSKNVITQSDMDNTKAGLIYGKT